MHSKTLQGKVHKLAWLIPCAHVCVCKRDVLCCVVGTHIQGVFVQELCSPGREASTHELRAASAGEPHHGSRTNEAQPNSENASELLRNTDQWVRLLVSQQLSLTNARTDISEVKQGSNNITANQRENWQSLAPRTAYHQRQGMARHNDEST